MVISEFIEKLEKIKEKKGDLEVVIWDYTGYSYKRAICEFYAVDGWHDYDGEVLVIDAED